MEYTLSYTGQNLKRGIELSKRGKYNEAMKYLTEKSVKGHVTATSHFAMCTVLSDCEKAIEINKAALKREDHNPEIYLNMGKLYNMLNKRELAYRALNQGFSIDPYHQGIKGILKLMGQRRKPPVPFLSRDNILNKTLGFLRV